MTAEGADLFFDYSKNRVTDETISLLVQLAQESGIQERIDAMFRGDKINVTENRAVLHVALRAVKAAGSKVCVVLLADGGWKYLSTGVQVEDPEKVEKDMEGQIWW